MFCSWRCGPRSPRSPNRFPVWCRLPPLMSIRESLLENFAGDLEYHPRRAAVYLFLAAGALALWFFSPPETKFTVTPLVFALGSMALTLKGVFLLRKSSEGFGTTMADVDSLSRPQQRKALPNLPTQAAQIVQDFGAGSMLLWPLLNMAGEFDRSLTDPPLPLIFLSGAILFGLGWLIRRFTSH
jgi:hypothetical protein